MEIMCLTYQISYSNLMGSLRSQKAQRDKEITGRPRECKRSSKNQGMRHIVVQDTELDKSIPAKIDI